VAQGQVTGGIDAPDGRKHAFLYDGTMRNLGTLDGTDSVGVAINDRSQVIGYSNGTDGIQRAFIWTEAGGMIDLNKVLHNPPPGLVLTNAFTISENGSIVAQANPGLVLFKPRK
jgi:probable HAF family extracellular repeat protein